MKTRIILATNNRHKLHEIQEFFSDLDIEILAPSDLNIQFSVEETGKTFSENALIKSEHLFSQAGLPSMADDSGICVSAMNGRPGVHSARYGSECLDDRGRAEYLLMELEGETDRSAWFECCISYTDSSGSRTFTGKCPGEITKDYDDAGGSGFGYDPVFYSTELGERFSRVSTEEKNSVSHRGRALRALKDYLARL